MKNLPRVSNDLFSRNAVNMTRLAAMHSREMIRYHVTGHANERFHSPVVGVELRTEYDWKNNVSFVKPHIETRYRAEEEGDGNAVRAFASAMLDAAMVMDYINENMDEYNALRQRFLAKRDERDKARKIEQEIAAAKIQVELDIRDPLMPNDRKNEIKDLIKHMKEGTNGVCYLIGMYDQGGKLPLLLTPTWNSRGSLAFRPMKFDNRRNRYWPQFSYRDDGLHNQRDTKSEWESSSARSFVIAFENAEARDIYVDMLSAERAKEE